MDFVFGVDGGQTSVKCVLATTEGEILGRGEGPGLIHLASAGGRERMVEALGQALTHAWRAAALAPRRVEAIGLGLSGVEAGTAEGNTVLELLPAVLEARRAVVHSDAFAALMGAHLGEPGVIAIAGTGSVVLGLNARGEQARAGGWGWLVGDEGSAVAIGRAGLLAALYAFDGVAPAPRLQEIIRRHFGITTLREAKRLVYAPEFGSRGFAALAPLVAQAAGEGEAAAVQIISDAGSALARQVGAVVRRLHFNSTVPVAPIGGAFEHVAGLSEAFSRALEAAPVETAVVNPRLPPVLGAVILAVKECGVNLPGALSRLQAGA